MSYLEGKKVILGVTGCIAAYKSAEILRGLQKKGAQVQVVMTESATGFINPNTFSALSGKETLVDYFSKTGSIAHIDLARQADLIIVAPATANTIAKIAVGIADNLLTTLILAMHSKLLIAPAMNEAMYLNPATQRNIKSLEERVSFVGPRSGDLACGETGLGRLSHPDEIAFAAEALVAPADFAGKRIVITAGATREYLDSVRFITNRSSGKMGCSLAREARLRGAKVDLVLSNVVEPHIPGVATHVVESSDQMMTKVNELFDECAILIMAAAVSDFRPEQKETGKKKRKAGRFKIDLVSTPDILAEMSSRKRPGQLLVGFSAEFGDPLKSAQAKLREKNADIMVANDVSREDIGFDSDYNEAVIVGSDEPKFISKRKKDEMAKEIFNVLAKSS